MNFEVVQKPQIKVLSVNPAIVQSHTTTLIVKIGQIAYNCVCLWLAEVCINTIGPIVEFQLKFQLKFEYLKSERLDMKMTSNGK